MIDIPFDAEVDESRRALLSVRGISKSFPGVKALDGVHLELQAGEVLALLGENGAGKSTLIKILCGVYTPDEGEMLVEGAPLRMHHPVQAQRAGITVIHQEFNLVPALSARENIFLNPESGPVSLLPLAEERRRARALFERIGVPVNPETLCRDLSVAEQQIVEIAKALSHEARIIVMDEPSAALSPQEVEGLFRIIRDLRAHGIGIVYVSHRLDEIFELADRVTILRDGKHVSTNAIEHLTRDSMIEMMVGRSLDQEFPKVPAARKPGGLVVSGLNRSPFVRNVSFEIRRGEILGLTGLIGSGRTETARLIFGADRRESGTIALDGENLTIHNPRQAIAGGICLLTEDRKGQGLILSQTVRENFGLPNMSQLARWGILNRPLEEQRFNYYTDQLQIKLTGPHQRTATLSGGNQQKVVLAKWLQHNAEVVIFDEPTRGIDVGAKYEIYLLMNQLAKDGKAVLMVSSELPEVLGMSDRILVMHEGRMTGEISDVAGATQEQLMDLAVQ